MIALLSVLVLCAIAAMFVSSVELQRVKDIFAIVFGPIAGLVGAVVGFYFGAKTGSESPDSRSAAPRSQGG